MCQGRTNTTSAQPGTTVEQLGAERAGMLAQILELAAQALPGAQQVSLTVPTPQGLTTAAATAPPAWRIDTVQYQTGEGPCVAATREGHVVLVRDLATETRWPRFASRMAGHSGVRSMLSLPVRTSAGVAGSLNASAAAAGVFDHAAGRIGSAFAALAGLALAATAEQARAVDRVAQLESVVALLVHDLRSGMTVAYTAEDFLTGQRSRLDPVGQEALDLLGDELTRQQRLLTELVELVRAELPSTRAAPLLPQVQQAVREHRHPVPVLPGPGADGAVVRIHPVRLRRILANLLHNADRHAGGATAVQVACTGNRASVAVEDAGPGVPAELREVIFTRLAPSSGEQGSHLGLTLSRLHARLAGGDLLVEDRSGGGARFVLLLPTADSPAAADRPATEADRLGVEGDRSLIGANGGQGAPVAAAPATDARGTGSALSAGPAWAEHRVAQRLAAVTQAVLRAPDQSSILERLLDAAAANLGLQVSASVSLAEKGRPVRTAAASDHRALRADQLQYELGEGPCLAAITGQGTVWIDDLTTDERHPGWARRAADEIGIRSVLSLPMGTDDNAGSLGSLNLYSTRPHTFDTTTRVEGLALAAQAAIAARAGQNEEHLRTAITTRTLIGQAQGILMERLKITADEAFGILSGTSSHTNVKLGEIARRLAETGELPTRQPPGRVLGNPVIDVR